MNATTSDPRGDAEIRELERATQEHPDDVLARQALARAWERRTGFPHMGGTAPHRFQDARCTYCGALDPRCSFRPGDLATDLNYGRACAVLAVRPKRVLVAVRMRTFERVATPKGTSTKQAVKRALRSFASVAPDLAHVEA